MFQPSGTGRIEALLAALCRERGLPADYATIAAKNTPSSMADVPSFREPHAMLASLADVACRSADDHGAELRLGREALTLTRSLAPAEEHAVRRQVLRALHHVAERANAVDRRAAYTALADEADAAYVEMRARWGSMLRPNTLRNALDDFTPYMSVAAAELERDVPTQAGDLERRRRARDQATIPEGTFFQKYRAGIIAVWRRDSREWWRQHYIDRHAVEPPDGWWVDNRASATGGQIAPGLGRAFDYLDDDVKRTYFDEMEARYRLESGLPPRGDGWVSETYLARCVVEALPAYEVVRQASPEWLGRQRLDIYVPALALAIEYQGVQHYEPVSLFGGTDALPDRQRLDQLKREACAAAGVHLIEWRYDEPVTLDEVRRRVGAG